MTHTETLKSGRLCVLWVSHTQESSAVTELSQSTARRFGILNQFRSHILQPIQPQEQEVSPISRMLFEPLTKLYLIQKPLIQIFK